MTEQEWLTAEDPQAMLGLLEREWDKGGTYYAISDRKLRLWCAALRLLKYGPDFQGPWDEGLPGEGHDDAARVARAWAEATISPLAQTEPPQTVKAALLRDIVGNHFRPVTLPMACPARQVMASPGVMRTKVVGPPRCPWLTPTVLALAADIYERRDFALLPVLADALEDVGCLAEEVLAETVTAGHSCPDCGDYGFRRMGQEFDHMRKCRRQGCGTVWVPGNEHLIRRRVSNPLLAHLRSPGPHVRGCWAVDLLLGKS